jgi:kynurenine 3-monooxygenase
MKPTTIAIAGAGLAGALLATLLAKRGHRVQVYERLPDLRREKIASGRSINLALAARGIRALELADMMEHVRGQLIPMPGRMLHDTAGHLTFVPYGQGDHEVIYSVSRPGLTGLLLDAAERAGAQLFFRHAATGIDLATRELHVAHGEHARSVPLERVIAADGAGSVVRRSLVDTMKISCSEELLEHSYKELTLPPAANSTHRIEANALHIWPRGGFMLIALPNLDGSFTVTLFLARHGTPSFDTLRDKDHIDAFFRTHFPDAYALMPGLATEFLEHPTGIMGTVRCAKWSADDAILLFGDAAHAITPFHGQGMNCAFEDCRVLAELTDTHDDWRDVFAAFEAARRTDTNAIADMALENYLEMRDTVRDPQFLLQRTLSLELERRFPDRFVPRYSMVMFRDDIPYSVAYERGRVQNDILATLTRTATSLGDIDYGYAAELIAGRLSSLPRA